MIITIQVTNYELSRIFTNYRVVKKLKHFHVYNYYQPSSNNCIYDDVDNNYKYQHHLEIHNTRYITVKLVGIIIFITVI